MITHVAILDTILIVAVVLLRVSCSYLVTELRAELQRLAAAKEVKLKELDAVLSQRLSLESVLRHCQERRLENLKEKEALSGIARLYLAKEVRLSSLAERRSKLMAELEYSARQEREATDRTQRAVHEKRRLDAETRLEELDDEIRQAEERPVEEPEIADENLSPESEAGDAVDG